MLVRHRGEERKLSSDHPFVAAIWALVLQAKDEKAGRTTPKKTAATSSPSSGLNIHGSPLTEELRAVWKNARVYRDLLRRVAQAPPEGIGHRELMRVLGAKPLDFRGMQTGFARICKGLGVENPIQRTGYSQANRVYSMEPVVAHTLLAIDSDTQAQRARRKASAR